MPPRHASLVYTSRATPDLTDPELEVILIRGRTLNAMRGITGVLIKNGPRICQYLEGEKDAIHRTFDRIRRNPLHLDVHLVAEGDDISRAFDHCYYAFASAERMHQRGVETDAWREQLDHARAQGAANAPLAHLVGTWDAWTGAGGQAG